MTRSYLEKEEWRRVAGAVVFPTKEGMHEGLEVRSTAHFGRNERNSLWLKHKVWEEVIVNIFANF